MRAATLFSGIGAPEVAMPHWHWLWHAEIEKFPAAVMAARHPSSVNLGDVTAPDFIDRAIAMGPIDVLMGGPPCQAFSVAGLRKSLDDDRGNLSLLWVKTIHAVGPHWAVTENVPGWLSTHDNAFGCFLAGLVGADAPLCSPCESGRWPSAGMVAGPLARAAWRILDAQYFGVAQRRARVFVVAGFRDWTDPVEILLVEPRLCGHPPARGQAREDITGTLAARTSAGGGLGTDFDLAGGVAATLDASYGRLQGCSGQDMLHGHSHLVAHSLRADGFDASEDGTGRGTPLVPVTYDDQRGRANAGYAVDQARTLHAAKGQSEQQIVAYTAKDYGGDAQDDLSPTLRSGGHDESHANAGVMPAVAFNWQSGGDARGLKAQAQAQAQALSRSQTPAVFAVQEAQTGVREYDTAGALRANGPGHDPVGTRIRSASGVRRLTPRECERLQAFQDDYTLIEYRGKPAADGPRYRAIGNSMCVNVVRWILERIEQVDLLSPRCG